MQDFAQGCHAIGTGRGSCQEKVVKDMDDLWDVQFMLNDPFEGRGELVKQEWRTPETEGKDHVEKIKALPFHPEEFPVRWVDWDFTEGNFDVQFRHEAILTKVLEYGNCMVHFDVLE